MKQANFIPLLLVFLLLVLASAKSFAYYGPKITKPLRHIKPLLYSKESANALWYGTQTHTIHLVKVSVRSFPGKFFGTSTNLVIGNLFSVKTVNQFVSSFKRPPLFAEIIPVSPKFAPFGDFQTKVSKQ